MSESGAEFLVVGDVHGQWSAEDAEFVERGQQDLTLFVGDLGDEDVGLVRRIAALEVPKGVILGNHDAWQSFSSKAPTAALREMIELLGDDHLAYSVLDVPAARISIVGARPFTWGGADIRSPEVYGEFFDVRSIEESAELIVKAATRAAFDDLMVFAHNGPHGLSGSPGGIYGKDFGKRPGGDWGDRDLTLALDRIAASGKRVRAVVAGHMHHRLNPRVGGGFRVRFVRGGGVSYLNPAVVPRIRRSRDGQQLRHYMRLVWRDGELRAVEEIWVDAAGDVRERFRPKFKELAPK